MKNRSPLFRRYPKITIVCVIVIPVLLCDLLTGILFIPKDLNNFRTYHPFYHHGMIPGKTGNARWGQGNIYPVATNSIGLIDSSMREIQLIPSMKRVVIIGDSFAEGIGVPFEKTFAGIIQKQFTKEGIDVLNASALSYSPKLYFLKIKYLVDNAGLKFNDLFVFMDISDIQDEILYRKFVPHEVNSKELSAVQLVKKLKAFSFFAYSMDTLYQKEKTDLRRRKYNPDYYPPWLDYFWLDNQDTEPYQDPTFVHLRTDWTFDEYFDNRWTRLGIDSAIENMNKLLQLCRSNHIDLFVVVYPWPGQIRRSEMDNRLIALWKSFCTDNKLTFINLFPDFIQNAGLKPEEVCSKYYIPGDVHWNEEGHQVVAKNIAQFISR